MGVDEPVAGPSHVDMPALWAVARGRLDESVKAVADAVVAGIECRLDPAIQAIAAREAHKLAGSLGTFGFHEGSRLARLLELGLITDEVLTSSESMDLSAAVVALQAEMSRPVDPAPTRTEDRRTTLLIIDGEVDRPRLVVEAAVSDGMHASSTATIDAARQAIGTAPPDAVVLDAHIDTEEVVTTFLTELSRRHPEIATVVLVGHAGVSERVQAARAGAGVVLETPVAAEEIVQAVARVRTRGQATSKVLALDDDPTFRVLIKELLRAEGVRVESIEKAADLWPALVKFEPDLLLLDNDMPGADGISLCRAIRSDERWARLPVVFLSASRSPELVRDMFDAGADDFVPKPVSADDLVNRVRNRLQRSWIQSERADIDLATGLPNSVVFVRSASHLVGLAVRDTRPAVFGLFEFDPPNEAALAALGRRLRQAVDVEDAVGAWPGGRVAALFYGIDGPEAARRLPPVLQPVGGDSPVGCSAGLAMCPDDGKDILELTVAAETALGKARGRGGDAIELHRAPAKGRSELVDVLLVDDDAGLATLVVHAISARGWSVRWIQDGAEAVELLDTPSFRARVLLLDVGLPGLDGLSVLRHVRETGRLATTRVVMLTVRANEGEVLEALDLGAFDHVAKPFGLSVLLHRIRRALESSV